MQIQVCQTKPAKKYERRDGLYRPAALLFRRLPLAAPRLVWAGRCYLLHAGIRYPHRGHFRRSDQKTYRQLRESESGVAFSIEA